MKFKEIKKVHLQRVIDECDKSYSVKHQIRVLFNQMFKYALENDITDKNYAQFIDMPPCSIIRRKKPFTDEEIQRLWYNVGKLDGVDAALIMIYTDLKIGELLEIECSNIHLDEKYMIGGFKTNK